MRNERENMADIATVEHAKGLSLEEELSRLLPLEQELHRLKARGPAVQHYLGLMPRLIQYACFLSQVWPGITNIC
jgi:hypothetical protein